MKGRNLKGYSNDKIKLFKNKCIIIDSHITEIIAKYDKNSREFIGKGIIKYSNKQIYEGYIKGSRREGMGGITFPESPQNIMCLNCEWKRNIPQNPIKILFIGSTEIITISNMKVSKNKISFELKNVDYNLNIEMEYNDEFNFENGYYIGSVLYGIPNGFGHLVRPNESTEGIWKNGIIDSECKHITPTTIYEGNIKNGNYDGYGILTYKNPESISRVYTKFENGIPVGGPDSIVTYVQNNMFIGTISNLLQREGYGTTICNLVVHIDCYFKNDIIDPEKSMYIEYDNRMYFGNYNIIDQKLRLNGKGWSISNNILLIGTFEYGELVSGYKINMNTFEVQEGTFIEGLLHGEATIYILRLISNEYDYATKMFDKENKNNYFEIVKVIKSEWSNGFPCKNLEISCKEYQCKVKYTDTKRHGQGVIDHLDYKYFGSIYNERKHGHGTLITNKGTAVVGYWKNDAPFGVMKLTNKYGTYEGELKSNLEVSGKGILSLDDNTKLIGSFVNGELIGDFIAIHGDTKLKMSKSKEGFIFSTYYLKKYYEGSIIKHGEAYLQFTANGTIASKKSVYNGIIKNFKRNGFGILTRGEYIFYGKWEDNKPTGNFIINYQNIVFKGKITEYNRGTFEGYGDIFYAEKNYYKGSVKNMKRHGKGILTYPDGSRLSGNWIDGLQNGVMLRNNNYICFVEKYVNGIYRGGKEIIL